MGQSSQKSGPLGRIERFLLGFLALSFLGTLAVVFLAPEGSLRFIPARERSSTGFGLSDDPAKGLRVSVAHVRSTETLKRLLEKSSFDPEAIRVGEAAVPPLFLAALPADLAAIESVQERKDLFLGIVLPLIVNHNSMVLDQRARLTRLMDESLDGLAAADQRWLLRLARHYKVIEPEAGIGALDADTLETLHRRVDAIPVSLALAQSAVESGWGTSRFARRGNALFGQWTWDEDAGIVPGEREEGRTHAVRAFKRLANSVRAYVHNLNVSEHYQEFRAARAQLRRDGSPDGTWGHVLTGHLGKYSEEGAEYIEKIRSIIRINGFGDFETARFAAVTDTTRRAEPGS